MLIILLLWLSLLLLLIIVVQGDALCASSPDRVLVTKGLAALLQGDVLCAEALNQILVTREGQSRLLGAFIHRVVPLHQTVSTLRTPRSNKTSWLATWRDRNIFLHRTHVGMAVQVRLASCMKWNQVNSESAVFLEESKFLAT